MANKSFTEPWKSIFDLKDDDLSQMVKSKDEVILSKVTAMYLNQVLTESEFHDHVWAIENLIRRVLPIFARSHDTDKFKLITLFKQLLSCIEKLLNFALDLIEKVKCVEESLEQVTVYLKLSMVLLDLCRNILDLKREMKYSDSVAMTLVHQIPDIIGLALGHCQNSPRIYGDSMKLLAEDLKNLFIRTKSTLTAFVEMVDGGHEQFVWTKIDQFVKSLDRLQPILLELDFHAFGLVCKTYVKMCKSHWSDLWESRFDAMPHLIFVTRRTEKSVKDIESLLNSNDEQGLKRESTILAFLLKTVRQQSVVIQDSLSDKTLYYSTLLGLATTLSSMSDLTTSDTSTPKCSNLPKLTTEIPSLIHSLMLQLAADQDFADFAVKLQPLQLKDVSHGAAIFWSNILAQIWNQKNVDLARIWFQDERNLFQLLISTLKVSHQLLCDSPVLTGVQFNGKPLSSFTSYEFILTRTQSFIAGLNPDYLSYVEGSLLEAVLDDSQPFWSGYFCVDIWAFLARYGPHDLCFSHVQLLIDLYLGQVTSTGSPPLPPFMEIAIRRLFSFLCAEDIKTIGEAYAVSASEQNLHLWKLIKIDCLLKNGIELTALEVASVTQLENLISSNLTPESLPLGLASMQLIAEIWNSLSQDLKVTVSNVMKVIWSKLDGTCDLDWKNDFVTKFMSNLIIVTEKIYGSCTTNDWSMIYSACNLAGQTNLTYLISRIGSLISTCLPKMSSDQVSIFVEKLTCEVDFSNPHLPLELKPLLEHIQLPDLVKQVDISTEKEDESYFSSLVHHSLSSNCTRPVPSTVKCSGDHQRLTKKRKLIESDEKQSFEISYMMSVLESIREKIQNANSLTSTRQEECLNAVKTLESFLAKNKD